MADIFDEIKPETKTDIFDEIELREPVGLATEELPVAPTLPETEDIFDTLPATPLKQIEQTPDFNIPEQLPPLPNVLDKFPVFDTGPVDPSEPPTGEVGGTTLEKEAMRLFGDTAKAIGVPLKLLVATPIERLEKAAATPFRSLSKVTSQTTKKLLQESVLNFHIARANTDEEREFLRGLKTQEIDFEELKNVPRDLLDGIKSLVPLPGFGDDGVSFGDLANENFRTLTGEEPSTALKVSNDISGSLLFLAGVSKIGKLAKASKFSKIEPVAQGGKLTAEEIAQAKKIFSTRKLAQLAAENPRLVRTEIAKAGGLTTNTTPVEGVTAKLSNLIRASKPARKLTEKLKTNELV